jgi:TatD DNase family protein
MPDSASDLIDYHCHLDLYPDYEAQFSQVATQRIVTLAVTTTPQAWPRNKELAAKIPSVRVALGLHPQLVGQHNNEMALFERYLSETRYVGEVGLDAGPKFYRTYDRQKAVFESVVRLCAEAGGKILSVHAVRSVRDVLEFVERHLAGTSNRVVLHWFSGSVAEARRAVELGCYFSINRMMFEKRDTALLNSLPRQRLLTETDGPFTQIEGRVAVPADVRSTVAALSECLAQDVPTTMGMLQRNLLTLEGPASQRG